MAKDPYKYFRIEARELLDALTRGILEREKGGGEVTALLRSAHTLKGAARVVKQPEIATLAHAIEDALVADPGGLPLSKERATELFGLLDRIGAQVRSLDLVPEPAQRAKPVEESPETLRVATEDVDALLRDVAETWLHVGAVRRALGETGPLRKLVTSLADELAETHARIEGDARASIRGLGLVAEVLDGLDRLKRGVSVDLDRVDAELSKLSDLAHRLRLLPARTIFPALARTVRDAAQSLGKRVDFDVSGGDVRLDASALAQIGEALGHVVRNAVTHGVESAAERVASGKPPVASVRLSVHRRGSDAFFACSDDGGGIDIAAVRAAAVLRGLLSEGDAAAKTPEQVVALLGTGGLTTMGDVSELSGRGIGLDVVRATCAALKGEMRVRSEAGRGTTVEVVVPVVVASLRGLVVEVAGTTATIPLDAIERTVRIGERDIAKSAGGDSIDLEGTVVPFLRLDRALRRPTPASPRLRRWSGVVVHADHRRAVIGVDRLLGTTNVVVRSLPDTVEADEVVFGASLDTEGNPRLVLDPHGLVAAAESAGRSVDDPEATRRVPILIVDDSMTTRMLEQSILESAGYEVDLAASGEEGLGKARTRQYSLFLVDVEMPGMNGFQFIAETRADPALRDVPSILVTSLSSPDDRRRGERAGARGYIVKGEFDQAVLLTAIRGLIG